MQINQSRRLGLVKRRISVSSDPYIALTGFSLVELLVVIAIVSVLIAVLLPALSSARKSVQRSLCMSNLRQVGIGTAIYLSDFKGRYPITPYNVRSGNANAGDDVCWDDVARNTVPTPTPNRSGWYQLRSLGHVPDKAISCPALASGSGVTNQLKDMGTRYRLSFGYRFNAIEGNNGQPTPSGNGNSTTTKYPKASSIRSTVMGLFADGSDYRRTTLAPYEELYLRGQGNLKYEWAHEIGGNIALIDGSVLFMPNFLPPASHGNGQNAAWPNAGHLMPWTNGSYSSGSTYSIDNYIKQQLGG